MKILNLIQGDMKTCRANVLCSLSCCRLSAFPYIIFPSLKLETLGKSSHQNIQMVKISALASSSGMLPQCTNGKHFDRKRSSFFKRVKQQIVSIACKRIYRSKCQEEKSWKGGELVYRIFLFSAEENLGCNPISSIPWGIPY